MTPLPKTTITPPPWRRETLRRLLNGVLFVGAIIACLEVVKGGSATPNRLEDPLFWLMFVPYVAVWFVRFGNLSDTTRARASVAAVGLAGITATVEEGLAPGPVLTVSLSVLIGTLLLGRAGLLSSLAFTGLSLLALGLAMDSGLISMPQNYLQSADWYAGVTAFVGVTAIAGGLVDHVVARLERVMSDVEDEVRRNEVARAELIAVERKLIRAQKLESLGLLAGGLAHDFNNTLQVIHGWVELLADEPNAEDLTLAVEEIKSTSESASTLVNQLLSFGQRGPRQTIETDLGGLLEGWRKSLGHLLQEGQTLKLEGETDISPPVVVDERQLEQVVMNLVSNAGDASSPGGRVCVGVRPATLSDVRRTFPDCHPHQFWSCLYVKDHGKGMDIATIDQIFDPFFSTKGVGGTGLGLSAVYGAVTEHAGHIAVHSELGQGSTFELFFPSINVYSREHPSGMESSGKPSDSA